MEIIFIYQRPGLSSLRGHAAEGDVREPWLVLRIATADIAMVACAGEPVLSDSGHGEGHFVGKDLNIGELIDGLYNFNNATLS